MHWTFLLLSLHGNSGKLTDHDRPQKEDHACSAVLYVLFFNTQNGQTPLMVASFKGRVDIVRILIEAKAQVNIKKEVCCSHHTTYHS